MLKDCLACWVLIFPSCRVTFIILGPLYRPMLIFISQFLRNEKREMVFHDESWGATGALSQGLICGGQSHDFFLCPACIMWQKMTSAASMQPTSRKRLHHKGVNWWQIKVKVELFIHHIAGQLGAWEQGTNLWSLESIGKLSLASKFSIHFV